MEDKGRLTFSRWLGLLICLCHTRHQSTKAPGMVAVAGAPLLPSPRPRPQSITSLIWRFQVMIAHLRAQQRHHQLCRTKVSPVQRRAQKIKSQIGRRGLKTAFTFPSLPPLPLRRSMLSQAVMRARAAPLHRRTPPSLAKDVQTLPFLHCLPFIDSSSSLSINIHRSANNTGRALFHFNG